MGNKEAIKFYNLLSKKIINPLELRNKSKDTSDIDVAFIKNFANKDFNLLDIGSGTGLLVNHLTENFNNIFAIEKYNEFSKYITNKVQVFNYDLLETNFQEFNFQVATAFGSMHYFDEEESKIIYRNVYNKLPKNGIFIVKNQMGVTEDVNIHYSSELNSNYFAQYRFVDKEIINLEAIGFTLIEKKDIYPASYNRFENTHFYALVLKKL